MARKLHVARVWQIEYKYPGMYGGDGQDIFYDILTMFEVDNSAEDAYTDDFEIARSGLQQLRKHISEQDETFRQNAEEFYSCLAKVGMDREKFIEVLDCLINVSDQSDAYVHVSWF